MRQVYHMTDAVLCGLGNDSRSVFNAVLEGDPGLTMTELGNGSRYPVARLSAEQDRMLSEKYGPVFTRFEKMCLFVIEQALSQVQLQTNSQDCVIILSTTKGNISAVGDATKIAGIPLHVSAKRIGQYFNNPNPVPVVSVACISGVAAQIMGKRLLEAGHYKYALVVGCDELSAFVIAGFHSFQALSTGPCRPFDTHRDGLNLGEAAACMLLSNEERSASGKGVLKAGAITNDANHLSGPSKTGAELGSAIIRTLTEANIAGEAISFVSAHGTATNYNDEMEAKAIYHAGVTAPVNSLKSYFGHTLGASGLLETVISLQAMEANILLPTLNFETTNVSVPISIIKEQSKKEIHNFVKTAAGFGGCNAALLWSKI